MERNTFFGVVSKVLNPDTYEIEIDIPGENERLRAFPKRSEVDEPRVGDHVLLTEFDPLYHTYYIYEKIKENDFIGIRSRGKIVKINKDKVVIGIMKVDSNNYKPKKRFPDTFKGDEWYDDKSGVSPIKDDMITSWISIDKDGNLEIMMEKDSNITIKGDCNIKVEGSTELNCPDVTITGGTLKTKGGTAVSNGMGGFCGLPNCLLTSAPHVTTEITGT